VLRLDRYSVFEEEVTDNEAPGYSDLVKFPMDFGTMSKKVKDGTYGSRGSEALMAFYKDFRRVFDNCYLYNDEDNEVTTEAIRVLSYLPETFVAACLEVKAKTEVIEVKQQKRK
jgi:bromodomain-containing protein 7